MIGGNLGHELVPAPELEDPMYWDPKPTGAWDFLLTFMTDIHKEQVRKQAMSEDTPVGYTRALRASI